jgi:hypothetical protein
MLRAVVVALLLLLPASALARGEKYHVRITGFEAEAGVPASLAEQAKAVLAEVLGKQVDTVKYLADPYLGKLKTIVLGHKQYLEVIA